MKHLQFFLHYAITHLYRDRQRSLFVLFCIAAGVASVVSLRTLGLMIDDTLSNHLQRSNRGDIVINLPLELEDEDDESRQDKEKVDRSLFQIEDDAETLQVTGLSHSGEARLQGWARVRGFETMPVWSTNGPTGRIRKVSDDFAGASVRTLCVDPTRYPFYGTVQIERPAKATLAQVLAAPYSMVVTNELAQDLRLQLGDKIHLAGSGRTFTLAAIVDPVSSEASLYDPFNALFSFIYIPYQTCVKDLHKKPNRYYIQMPAGNDANAIKQEILSTFRGLEPTTTEDLRELNRRFSDVLLRLVTIMGLASLLIGGIGIANTMAVVVRQRMREIAVLKTIGVQGNQIALMFIVETIILSVMGSLLGLPLGLGLVFILKGFGERFVGQAITFAIYPEALGIGLVLGVIVTVVFGLLPILSATRVRPNLVLRPNETAFPEGGRLASLGLLMALTAIMGLVVGQIIENIVTGLLLTYVMVLLLALAMLGLRLVVWVISHLPSFGIIFLKLSQRGISAQKGRVASTLLALIVGLFSLSSILLFVQGSIQAVTNTADKFFEGNLIVVSQSLAQGKAMERKIARMPDITFKHDEVYTAEIIAINGNRDIEALKRQAYTKASGSNALGNPETVIDEFVSTFTMKVLDENTWDYQIVEGEDIVGKEIISNASNSKTPILLEASMLNSLNAWFDLKVGNTITFRFPDGAKRTVVIGGITAPHNAGLVLQGAVEIFRGTHSIVPARFIPTNELPQNRFYFLNVPTEQMNETMDTLSLLPGTFVFATAEFLTGTERFANQFVPLPIIVAILALFASSVIIANTVSLATLERRRQIGIMRAIGLQAETVLGLLLLENGLVGLIGGLLGTGLSVFVLSPSDSLTSVGIPLGALGLLILLAVGLTLGATLLTAYGASREKPLNVLRYDG